MSNTKYLYAAAILGLIVGIAYLAAGQYLLALIFGGVGLWCANAGNQAAPR